MRRSGEGRYADHTTANPNSTSQMLHSAQRTSINPVSGLNQYISPKSQAQWQWERDGSDSLSRAYNGGQGNDASRSSFQEQYSETRRSVDRTINAEPIVALREQGMDVRYNESSFPQTYEDLEQKFLEDIKMLTKEEQDAEDAENARHRERLNEINSQYQEKLLTMRSRQYASRDEFLRKESHARRQEYHQVHLNYQNSVGAGDFYGFAATESAAAFGETQHRAYGGSHVNAYGDRQFSGPAGGRGFEARGPYPGGRVYTGGRRF